MFGRALTDAQDRTQASRDGTGELLRDTLVGVTEVAPDLRVPDDGSHREPAKHRDGDLPGEGPALFPMHVLRVNIDVRVAECIRDRR